ncbi:MAG: C1 family peptidase, partial [Verrucomicrobiota bacterium]
MNAFLHFRGSATIRSAATLFVILFALPLHAQSNAAPDEPHALGLRPPTAEEDERMRVLAPRVLRVLPNARALARANNERAAKGLAPLAVPVVPDGEEIIVAPTAATSAPEALQISPSTPALAASAAPSDNPTTPPMAADAALASAADNSTLPAFPPIRNQGQIGSCACFSSVYYMSTFMVAQARGLNVRNSGDADKLSPKFVYALVNKGGNNGTWFTDIFDVLINHGAPTWSAWPYSGVDTPSSYLEWPVNSVTWRGALANRMASSYTLTDIDTDAGLSRLKTALANGLLVVFASNINGWQFGTASDDPATPDDNALVGRPICKAIQIHDSGHAMTIVGYNDNIWVDLNKNGRVDPGEKGA